MPEIPKRNRPRYVGTLLAECVLIVTDENDREIAPDEYYWYMDFMAIGERRKVVEASLLKIAQTVVAKNITLWKTIEVIEQQG